jgi:hypothetical protein
MVVSNMERHEVIALLLHSGTTSISPLHMCRLRAWYHVLQSSHSDSAPDSTTSGSTSVSDSEGDRSQPKMRTVMTSRQRTCSASEARPLLTAPVRLANRV